MTLPESYERRMKALLEDYPAYRDSLSQPWERGLRLNPLKIKSSAERGRVLEKLFGGKTPERIPWSTEGYYFSSEIALSEHPYFHAGLYYLQEPSAQAPASELPVRPGDRVLDLCAAPGGKSTQLLAKLQGKGLLVANDPSAGRAAALRKNLERFGAANAFVTVEEPSRLARFFPSYFHAILVDAPCSGSGMFRKEPAMTAFYEEKGPEAYVGLQEQILESAVSMLKPGGYLLYSTCTFATEEDEEQMQKLIRRHPELSLQPLAGNAFYMSKEESSFTAKLFPHRVRGEGQFLALLKKMDAGTASRKACPAKTDGLHLYEKEECVYLLPEGIRPQSGLRYLMTGLCVAKRKGKRLKPTQALAMALTADSWPGVLVLSAEDERILRYLKGETIPLLPKDEIRSGKMPEGLPEELDLRSLLVTVEGYPLGFALNQNGQLKNLRDSGWRIGG